MTLKPPYNRPLCIQSHHSGNYSLVMDAFLLGCKGVMISKDELMSIDPKLINAPIIIRGLPMMIKLKSFMDDNNLDYYFIDTGYIGNYPKKKYHRVTKNAMQAKHVIKRPPDRIRDICDLKVRPWSTKGSKILLCPPSAKSLIYYADSKNIMKKHGGSYQDAVKNWVKRTCKELKRHTDRPIEIRYKPRPKKDRRKSPFKECVLNNVFATVTFNSIVAVESIVNGIPAFVCAENAASPVALSDISKIETPLYPNRHAWLRHLAYCQFSLWDFYNGFAWKIATNTESRKDKKRRAKAKKDKSGYKYNEYREWIKEKKPK